MSKSKEYKTAAEVIMERAKAIFGVKDFGMISKLTILAQFVKKEAENRELVRELYWACPSHRYFEGWTDQQRAELDALKAELNAAVAKGVAALETVEKEEPCQKSEA